MDTSSVFPVSEHEQTEFVVRELLYADAAALCASSPEQQQILLVMFQGSQSAWKKKKKNSQQKDCVTCCQHNTHHFQFKNVVFVDDVEKIAYLGSTVTRNATLDDEILISLTNHMWQNKHLSVCTKTRVCEAWVLSIRLYGTECWTSYRESRESGNCLRFDTEG